MVNWILNTLFKLKSYGRLNIFVSSSRCSITAPPIGKTGSPLGTFFRPTPWKNKSLLHSQPNGPHWNPIIGVLVTIKGVFYHHRCILKWLIKYYNPLIWFLQSEDWMQCIMKFRFLNVSAWIESQDFVIFWACVGKLILAKGTLKFCFAYLISKH